MSRCAFLILLLSLPWQGAQAFEYEFFEHASISARVSTLGLGAEVSIPLLASANRQTLALRAGASAFRYSSNTEEDQVQYETTFNLATIHTLLDWYPWQGAFRLTGGLMLNGNQVDIVARPSAGGFNFGGVPYAAGSVDRVDGDITFNYFSPYVGIGWDWGRDAGAGLSFALDLGLMYHGSPDADLTANCGPALTTLQCDDLRSDVEQEEKDLNEALKDQVWYPVAGLNTTFRF